MASGSPRQKQDTEAARQSAYQEIHAAILELYRLMGVPRSTPVAGAAPYFPGYSVYTYPAAAQAPGYATLAGPGVPAWPAPLVAGPTAILNHFTQPVPSFQAVQRPGQTWATGASFMEFERL